MKNPFIRSITISSVLVFGSLIVGTILLSFFNSRLGDRAQRIADARSVEEQYADEVHILAELKEMKPLASRYARAIDLLLPQRDDLFAFEGWLESVARTRNVSLRANFEGEPSVSRTGVIGDIGFAATVVGTETDVMGFLRDLEPERPHRFLMTLSGFTMNGRGDVYTLSLQGKVYFR